MLIHETHLAWALSAQDQAAGACSKCFRASTVALQLDLIRLVCLLAIRCSWYSTFTAPDRPLAHAEKIEERKMQGREYAVPVQDSVRRNHRHIIRWGLLLNTCWDVKYAFALPSLSPSLSLFLSVPLPQPLLLSLLL